MALSSDEERILLQIEQHLGQDDPRFAHRITAAQRHMRLRHVLPFYRLCLLLVVASVIGVLAVIAADTVENTDPLVTPSQQVTADQRDFPVVEPR